MVASPDQLSCFLADPLHLVRTEPLVTSMGRRTLALVASCAVDAADYRVESASEDYDGDQDIDFEAEAQSAMATEARQQLADLDALVPYAAQLSRARFGLPLVNMRVS